MMTISRLSSRFGALASRLEDDDIRTLVADAIQVVGAGLDALSASRRRAVHDTVVQGGRVEVRVAIGAEIPVVSLYLCALDGTQEELGHCRMSPDLGSGSSL